MQRLPLVVVYVPRIHHIVQMYEIPNNNLYNYSIRDILNMDNIIDSNYIDRIGDIYDHIEDILLKIYDYDLIEGYIRLYPNKKYKEV